MWSYVYNIVRVSSAKVNKEVSGDDSTRIMKSTGGMPTLLEENYSEALLPSKDCSISVKCTHELTFSCTKSKGTVKVALLYYYFLALLLFFDASISIIKI